MPWKSDAQRKWGHTKEGMKALGGKKAVAEWDAASKGLKLPEHVKKPKKKKYQLAGLVPGTENLNTTGHIAPMGVIPNQMWQQQAQADYNIQRKGQLGQPNYDYMAMSQGIQGIAAFFRQIHANSEDNKYYQAQMNPLGYLPQTGNTSQQNQFGSQYFKKGGVAPQKPVQPTLPQSLQRYNKQGQPVNIGQEEEIINAYVSTISDPNQQQQVIDQLKKLKKTNPSEYYKTLSMIAQQIQQSQGQEQNLNPAIADPSQPQMTGQPMFQTGGTVNTTGYLDGFPTANNPYNIIPGGDITMQGVSQPILATPIKKGKTQPSMIMNPGANYKFNADYVHEQPVQTSPFNFNIDSTGLNLNYKNFGVNLSPGNIGVTYKKTFQTGGEIDLDKELEDDIFSEAEVKPKEEATVEETPEETPEESTNSDDQAIMDYLLNSTNSSQRENLSASTAGSLGESPETNTELAGHPTVQAFKSGIANVESGGDYYAQGKGSTAYGKYQMLKGTREGIRKQFFPQVSASDFERQYRTDPKFQERVMDVYSSHLLTQFPDPKKAAIAYFLGPGNVAKVDQPSYNPGGNNVSVAGYLNKFASGYNNTKYQEGGEYEVSDEEIEKLKSQGYKFKIK